MQTNRRTFMKAGGVAALLGTTGLAGCGGILGGGGGPSAPGDWLYDPSEVTAVPNVFFGSMAYSTLYEKRDQLPESMQGDFEGDTNSPLKPEDIENLAGVGGADISSDMQSMSALGSAVVTGSIPRSKMESEIESEEGTEQTGSYEGFTLYENSSVQNDVAGVPGQEQFQGSGTVAVGDGAILLGFAMSQNAETGATGQDALKTMIDAGSGNAKRLSDTSGSAQQVRDRVGDSMIAVGAGVDPELSDLAQQVGGSGGGGFGGQLFAGLRGGGFGADIEGESTTFDVVIVYDSEQSASDAGIADLVSGMSARFEDQEGIDTVESTQDGGVVVVTVAGDTKTLLEQGTNTGGTLSVASPGQP
jgi:hypothetical protein